MDPLAQLLLIIVTLLVAALAIALMKLFALQKEMAFRIEQRVSDAERGIREEALSRSRATLKGRVAEQISLGEPETRLDEVLPDEVMTRRGDYRKVLGKAFSKREGQVFPSGVMLVKDDKQTRSVIQWRVKREGH